MWVRMAGPGDQEFSGLSRYPNPLSPFILWKYYREDIASPLGGGLVEKNFEGQFPVHFFLEGMLNRIDR